MLLLTFVADFKKKECVLTFCSSSEHLSHGPAQHQQGPREAPAPASSLPHPLHEHGRGWTHHQEQAEEAGAQKGPGGAVQQTGRRTEKEGGGGAHGGGLEQQQ